MRKNIKIRVLALCETMALLHGEIVKTDNLDVVMQYLGLCEESAVTIMNILDNEKASFDNEIILLNSYCDELFELSKKGRLTREMMLQADDLIGRFTRVLTELQPMKEVVFFPYQPSMWDCLESVYLAFSKREDCHCSIVPIPYFTADQKKKTWEFCYKGEEFTEMLGENIEIVHYSNYKLEELKPDFGFIHNPYDEHNYVTRVHEDYFSYNLKKHVDKLTYIPYYTLAGKQPEKEILATSAYFYADYIVVQSEMVKEQYIKAPFYKKVIAMGSPKFDSILKSNEKGGVMPKEWEAQLKDKTVIMLNVTISTFLHNTEVFFNKLNMLFDLVKATGNTALIFRPHPLLLNTVKSMRPESLDEYTALLDRFHDMNIGVLDTTPSINNSVALSSAYIDSMKPSSVINLFAVSAKPIFLVNYNRKIMPRKTMKMVFRNIVRTKSGIYVLPPSNMLFKIDDDLKNMHYKGVVDKEQYGQLRNFWATECNNNLYFAPYQGERFYMYDLEENEFKEIGKKKENDTYVYPVSYNDKVYYLPFNSKKMAIYNTKTSKLTYNEEFTRKLARLNKKNAEDNKYEMPLSVVQNYVVKDNLLFMCTAYSDIIVEFNMDTEKYVFHNIGDNYAFTDINYENDDFYLTELNGDIIKWNYVTKEVNVIKLPSGFEVWKHEIRNINMAYNYLLSMKDCFIATPAFSNSIVRIDKKTNETKLLLPEIFSDLEDNDTYKKGVQSVCTAVCKLDETTIIMQLVSTYDIIKIDIEHETYEIIEFENTKEMYRELKLDIFDNTLGFYKNPNSASCLYYKREDNLNHLHEFIEEVSQNKHEEIKPIQIEYAKEMSSNLDGTSGESICEYLLGEK